MATEKKPRRLFRGAPFVMLALGGLGFLALSSLRQPPETRSTPTLAPVVATVPVGASPSRLRASSNWSAATTLSTSRTALRATPA